MAESHNTDEKYTVNVKELCEELADNEKVQAITIEELSPRRESLILCVYGPRNDEIKTEYDYMEIGGDE